MKKLIFATGNPGKLKEIRAIMGDMDMEILTMKEAGINVDIVEDGKTFEENAIIKVKTILAALPEGEDALVMADDSGLEVDAMDKAPGVYSARWMGEDTSYRIKNMKIVELLEGVPVEKRTARFVCTIAAGEKGKEILVARGVIEGKIGYEERGENGFGYDPIFYLPDMSRTTAELSPEEKNAISHRGNALRAMKKKLQKK
ncbi:MAG: RdgB/HAM1 family non-canonical purine NTP pyrophosphatase [Lachnospiraceae bacterium]|nr:RdgB/HAM1 family non-canonical purine NTP pyrophosphatase [Lachnospiraceae bacterium]